MTSLVLNCFTCKVGHQLESQSGEDKFNSELQNSQLHVTVGLLLVTEPWVND